ncbi:class I SAM-dependent methyltransferase [Haloferax sp. DFSO60]|uniref:class I SAM-dependent methyltransferase n=1 Tax=Haloferax sp. DFSO60 TaxID=3388652 RepID=UPI00397A9E8D
MHGAGDVRFFDRFAPLYDIVMPPAESEALSAGLARADVELDRVIDIGGGSGRATLALPVSDPLVFDQSAGMLSRASNRGLDCVQGDARSLPFSDESIDAVTVVDAFHHMPNQRTVTDEVVRVLKPGGVFVVQEFNPKTVRGRGLELAEKLVGFGSAFSTPRELTRFLEQFELETEVVEDGFEFTVVAKKRESH